MLIDCCAFDTEICTLILARISVPIFSNLFLGAVHYESAWKISYRDYIFNCCGAHFQLCTCAGGWRWRDR